MIRQNVLSSNIASIGYDPDGNVLEVEFKKGEVYHYYGVPQRIYDELMAAESHGKYFAAHVKNVYRYTRVK